MPIGPPFATAQQQAYGYLREKILSGEFASDLKLNPAEIAAALGISRVPVREALLQLDAEGLVTLRPNRSAVVTRLTASEVEELFAIRALLEGLAVKFAMPNLTEEAVCELVALKEGMDRVRHDPRLWINRHNQFHQFICDIGKRRRLAQEIARTRQAVQPYLLMYMSVYRSTEMVGYEHDTVVQALLSGDVAAAETCMRDHVQEAGAGVIKFLEGLERDTAKVPHRAAGAADASAPPAPPRPDAVL